jgi:hypothetical protein
MQAEQFVQADASSRRGLIQALDIATMVIAKLEEQDYLSAQALHRRWTKRKAMIALLALVGAGILSAILWYLGIWVVAGGLIGGLVGGAIGDSIVRYGYMPWKTKRVFRQQKSLQHEFVLSWTADGVHTKNAKGEYSSAWSDFVGWRENDRLFLLYISDIMFYMIPKRAFSSELLLGEFRAHLTKSILAHSHL